MKAVVTYDRIDGARQEFHRRVGQGLSDGAVQTQGAAQRLAPVDTGRLRASITSRESGPLTWEVYTNIEYAPYQEYGTRYQAGKPFMRPAYERERPHIIDAISDSLRNL